MSQFDWAAVREAAIRRFHDAPSGVLEQRIIDVFRDHPAMVVEAVAHVGARFEAGKIRAPWVILAQHVEQAVTPLENVSATDTRDRGRMTSRTEQWMRAAGKHFDNEDEVLDELFGELGRLRHWADDERLRERMLKLWREARTEGELIERDVEERAKRWKDTTGAMRLARLEKIRDVLLEPDPDFESPPVFDDVPEAAGISGEPF